MKKIQSLSFFQRYQPSLLLLSFAFLQVLIIGITFTIGYIVRDIPFVGPLYTGNRFPLLLEAIEILEENALNPLPDEKQLEYGMIRGILQTYDDPYTVFVEPPQHELQTNQLEGKFGGIGVRIDRDIENKAYLFPLPESPAKNAGILDGDMLYSVDSLLITSEVSDVEIQAAVRGPVGEDVSLIVGHAPSYDPVKLNIKRSEVVLPSVTWNISPIESNVGVVQIRVIAETTPIEVTKAIRDLQQRGVSHFVVDVRDNGGGLVEAGVNTARLFLKNGIVIQQQYRGEDIQTFLVDSEGPFTDIPLVILVNRGTASAAEIFAGALKGQKRAMIIGSQTYGKSTIQLVFKLKDGSSLHVTAAKWWIPGLGTSETGSGLQPDVVVENPEQSIIMQVAINMVIQ